METTTADSGSRKLKRSIWRKLLLLMWKNLLLRKRHWILTAFEILLPTLLFTLLLTIRVLPDSAFQPAYVNESTEFKVATECALKKDLCSKYGFWSTELHRCFVADNIDFNSTFLDPDALPVDLPSLEDLQGLNITEESFSDLESLLLAIQDFGAAIPGNIDEGIIQAILESFDVCILEDIDPADLEGLGVTDILGILADALANVTVPDLPDSSNFTFPGERKIFYGPPGAFAEDVAKHVAKTLRLSYNVLNPVQSNEELDAQVDQSYFATNDSWAAFYVGLFFNNLEDPDQPPQNLDYDLRLTGLWLTGLLYPYLQIPGPRNFTVFGEGYNVDGFTLIQSVVDRYYISRITNETRHNWQYRMHMQMYPYPPYTQDYGMSQFYGSALPTFVVLSLVLLSPSLIKSVVYEKETGVKELIRMMGLERWLVWFGWFLHSFLVILVVSTIMTLLLKLEVTPMDDMTGYLPPIIIHSDPLFLWVFFVLYGISSIAFCFVVSTFFSRPTLATTVGILFWMTSYFIPRQLMDFEYNDLGLTPKVLSCFLPNMAITWGFRIISMFEGRSVGVQWDNIWETGNPRDQLTPALVLIMLAVDTVLFLIITWYVDHVSPGKYGVPLPLHFPFQRSYWCGATPTERSEQLNSFDHDESDQYFEPEPEGLKAGIVIKNLRKEFKSLGKTKVAVENVSLSCFEGQCTVLLGHNGAGKTTTMSVLTGVYAPTSGYAEVGGWDIVTNLRKAREEVGLCPQHNMLFTDLTVLQHLLFFGRLKGMTKKDARKEADQLMERLELKEKKNMFGNQLSGGMKRKLCLAIALIGGSKVVILDEPSSGLDPESRRWVWDVVQGERGRRTVLVTTHHMEEADVLGDRIAIMASGKVVCSGSTLFLKNKFGDGYTLTIMVSEGSNIAAIKAEVKKHLPEAIPRSSQGGEVTFKLPPTTALFPPLLDSLTSQKKELGIRHLGLSLTSMEQVFLRVGDFAEGSEAQVPEANGSLYDRIAIDDDIGNGTLKKTQADASQYSSQRFLFNSQAEVDSRLTGWLLLKQRLKAFLTKRVIYSKRKWVLLLTQGLLPVIITIICLLVDSSFDENSFQEQPRLLNLSAFTHSKSYVHADPSREDMVDPYQSLFFDPYEVEYTENLTDALLAEADADLFHYRENNICSADFQEGLLGITTNVLSLYQSVPYHTPGISVNLATNALLRHATNSSSHSITTTNRPLPPNRTWRVGRTSTSGSAFVYAMVMPLALAFLSASFLVFPLEERETKAKQVQIMTGAPVWALWSATFFWDFLTYMVSAIAVFIFFVLMDFKDYFTVDMAPGALFLLLTLYGWGSIPMAYIFSFPFQTAASGFAVLALMNIVAGQIITTAVWALELSDQPDLIIVSDVLHWVTSLIPTYPASMGFMNLVDTSIYNTQCDQFNETVKADLCQTLAEILPNSSYMICCPQCATVGQGICFEKNSYFMFGDSGMGPNLLTLFVNGVIFFALLVLLESKAFTVIKSMWLRLVDQCCRSKSSKTAPAWELTQDDDVAAEAALVDNMMEERQASGGLDDASLLVSGLSKHFIGAPRPAVNSVSFGLRRGECLGLLGVNGAGKTTTFRMLTGDEEPSSGDAMIENISLSRDKNKFVQQIGYCPQFDAVLGELTAIEMLTLVGRLRGVSAARMKRTVNELVTLVGLTECASRPSSTYSGGNRRKLSTAMALVGSPQLVFLDEPTSGVDPASRRRVWTAVTKAVNNGQSVVLTSHSMEECEALCSRIIIMSRGTLRCVGTTSHLKAKFGQGYSLQIKLRTHGLGPQGTSHDSDIYNSKVKEVKTSITYHLPGAVMVDQHRGMLAYRIPSRISWGRLFSVMEALKNGRQPSDGEAHEARISEGPEAAVHESIVEDYAASDTSLEQVFLSFARENSDANQNKSIPTEVVTKL